MSSTTFIETSVSEHILSIRFNRPERKNAINFEMYIALADAFAEADSNPDIRVVFISGDEDCFCAGNDLADFNTGGPAKGEKSPGARFLNQLRECTKPIVAAVAGPAIGVGTTMLLHCDLVYAAPSANFKMPFTQLGLCPEASSSYLIPALVGQRRASELLLLGRPFSPSQAIEYGIINDMFNTELITRTYDIALELAALPPGSVQLSKKLMKEPVLAAAREADKNELLGFAERLRSEELKEAMKAFFEKRPADFSRF